GESEKSDSGREKSTLRGKDVHRHPPDTSSICLRESVRTILVPSHSPGASENLPCRASATTVKKATTTMKKSESGAKEAKAGESPSQLIDARIKELGDWRGEMLARIRSVIKEADPDMVEEWKWRGVPVWEHAGIICT